MELEKYTQYQETKLHGKLGFAYATYLCTIPLDFDRVNLPTLCTKLPDFNG